MNVRVTRCAARVAATHVSTPSASHVVTRRTPGHDRRAWFEANASHRAEAATREAGGRVRHVPGTIMERPTRGSGGRTAESAGLLFTLVNAPNAEPE